MTWKEEARRWFDQGGAPFGMLAVQREVVRRRETQRSEQLHIAGAVAATRRRSWRSRRRRRSETSSISTATELNTYSTNSRYLYFA